MSQASQSGAEGDKLWRCRNPKCSPPPFPIKLEVGLRFNVCPFCCIEKPNLSRECDSTSLQPPPLHSDSARDTEQLAQDTSSLDISSPEQESTEPEESVSTAGCEQVDPPPRPTPGPEDPTQQWSKEDGSTPAVNKEPPKGTQASSAEVGQEADNTTLNSATPDNDNTNLPVKIEPSNSSDIDSQDKANSSQLLTSQVNDKKLVTSEPPKDSKKVPTKEQGGEEKVDVTALTKSPPPPEQPSPSSVAGSTDPTVTTNSQDGSDDKAEKNGLSCRFCEKNLLDPTAEECSHCHCKQGDRERSNLLLEKEGTEQVSEGQHEKRKEIENSVPCEHCKAPLLEPDAVVCDSCNRSQRQNTMKRLLKQAQTDPPPNIPTSNDSSQCPQVFGPTTAANVSQGSNMPSKSANSKNGQTGNNPLDPNEESEQEHNKECEATTVGSFIQGQQRKRSLSFSRGEAPSKQIKRVEDPSSDGENPKPGSIKITSKAPGTTTTGSTDGDNVKPKPDSTEATHNKTQASASIPPNPSGDLPPTEREGAYYSKPTLEDDSNENKKKKKKKKNKGGGAQPEANNVQPSDNPADENVYKSLKGYNGPKTIEVVFHVIIPKPFWEWNAGSKVFLRFGNENLGGWDENIGLFAKKDIDEDKTYCEMFCSLRINPEVLKLCVPYKYVVFTPKTRSGRTTIFENLGSEYSHVTRHREPVNRALNVPPSKQAQALEDGYYHQYDLMTFPQDLKISRGWFESETLDKMKSGLMSLFRIEEKPKPPSDLDTQKICLQYYLKAYRFDEILATAQFNEKMTIDRFIQLIHHIFTCVTEVSKTNFSWPISSSNVVTSNSTHLMRKYFVEWLVPHIKSVQEKSTEKQLQGAVCAVWCIFRFKIGFTNAEVKSVAPILLKLLCVRRSTKEAESQWMEYNQLVHCFLQRESHREEVAEAVCRLSCASAADKSGALSMDWICGIPLYSFLTGKFVPYDNVCGASDGVLAETWSKLKEKFKLSEMTRKFESEKSKLIEKYYEMVMPLIDLDPLTLQAFVYICPDSDLPDLFARIPPNVCSAWLSYLMTNLHYHCVNKDEASQWTTWIYAIQSNISAGKCPSALASPSALLSSALSLFKRLTLYVRNSLEQFVRVILAGASLVCTVLQHISGDKEEMLVESFNKVLNILRDWIGNKCVIGGRMFGCEPVQSGSHFSFSMGLREIEIWKIFLSLECNDQRIHEEWLKIVHNLLSERVNNIPEFLIIQLLRFVERNGNEFLTNVAMNYAVKAAENLLSKPADKQLESVDEIIKEDSKAFGIVLGAILEKRYPQLKEDNDWITLDVLLEWVVWPNYLKIVMQGNECLLKEGLSQECQIACVCALSKFKEEICTQIQCGKVTVFDLHKMSTNRELVERLCKAVEDKEFTYSSLSAWLDQRVKEFQFFQKRRRAYQTICNWIPGHAKVEGLSSLKDVLKEDVSNKPINELCRFKDGAPVLLCYATAKPLDSFADYFNIMMNKSSNLFVHPLEVRLKRTVASRTDLTIADIHSEIWQPVFDKCRKLLDSLIDQSMTLSNVDAHLKKYSQHLDDVVYNLAVGLSRCLNEAPDQTRLRRPLWNIRQYWKLCEYRAGAEVFLQLRNVLNLSGDFALVERFSSQLSQSMKDQTLASIDANLIDTGYFLEDIVNDPQKNKCLQTFRDCQELVTWLKDFTKSVNDIQGFVTVALATAAGGEGDLAHDMLSHLRTVGSGFASLIYEVKQGDDYRMLKKRCESLWEALEKNRNLPELLISCNDDLEWYKSVKETQGSMETTSYGQMTNILKYGTYRVGFRRDAKTVHDLITVTLTQRYQKLIKTRYSLDELRDLESKLVLICGNKADARAEVDHYLNLLHSATRIAELYLDLQRAGDVTYSSARLKFRCAVYGNEQHRAKDQLFNEALAKKRVSDLQEYTRMLNTQLVEWKRSVDTARGQYYELNYFTTLQLLELRQELGHMATAPTTPPIKPSVLMLLRSVSPCVTSTVISESLLAAQHEQEPVVLDEDECEESATESGTEDESESESMEDSATSFKKPVPSRTKASPSVKPSLPALRLEDLDEKQQSDYTYLVKRLGYSDSHVLRAFQECDKDSNVYDIEDWCESHEDHSPAEQEEELHEEDDVTYYESEESEAEEGMDASTALSPLKSEGNTEQRGQHFLIPESSPSIRTVVRQAVDENHPDVQELVGVGYDFHAVVEAIDQFRDVGKAMEYLDEQERGEMEGAAGGEYVRSISRENRVEETEVDENEILEHRDSEASKSHLELDQLGRVLQAISSKLPGAVCEQRTFASGLLKAGLPNLLVTSSDNVLRSVLALYTTDTDHPLPTQEEVLLCTSRTTTEEVSLLWRRAIGDPYYLRVFCLAHAEKLSYQVCDAALRSLAALSQGRNEYRLVVICSKEDEDKSHIISRLHTFRRPVVPQLVESQCRDYLKSHFTLPTDMDVSSQAPPTASLHAAMVDPDNSCVRVVSSTRSGMGKSLYIKRRAQELIHVTSNYDDVHVTIPIHGPTVTNDVLLEFLNPHTKKEACTLYHLDIAPRVLPEVDCLLFSLLILNGLSDSRGHVWRSQASQLYMVEVTLPENMTKGQSFQTLNLLSLLPTVQCASPRDVNRLDQLGPGVLGMDQEEFEGPTIQRVYQYLRRHAAAQNLDTFSYRHGCVEGGVRDFLKIILSKCGIRDPSWAEVHHFTKFLDIQLHSCESSVFCDETLVGDVMSGLKGFVVKFMIRMSQDFSTPSLEGVLARENDEDGRGGVGDDDQLEQYQIVRRRQWEQSSHPYIFFNDDRVSITFVGFRVTQTGDLIDPGNMMVIEAAIMRPQLYTGLKHNRVHFDEDYRGWSKEQMITKIATVMGFEFLYDPDPSYVFTTDNLIKMLAIQMRFRCDIPVVIMGETGCGKTRLIRYMCDLARHGRDLKNMLILKIHGGITDQEVIKFVEDAEKVARANKDMDTKLSTVVFFDEANTTESIGLIKEIMCDWRMNGRPISRDLKFIAACNPYRRHSEEMIEKLETAGLGFYVRETETQQKLGKIPLRQLVYRVLDLPPSMTPLVYDFGQLNTGTEQDYTSQIVRDHVNRHPGLSRESPAIIPAISVVLAASQKFMRDQQNECSFVSLRDVERAMIVFEYFYEKMDSVFARLMDERAQRALNEQYAVDSEDEDEEEPAARPPPSVPPNALTRALLLSLSVCYHARLQDREPYEKLISTTFRNPLDLPGGDEQFRNEIKWCQEGLLDNMVLGPNIAKNAALRENVFMMAVCIELRIPLFLVGKPGSSKSLAKSIIQDSMHGQGSQSPLLREFKQVHMFSYQCSQLSTPESVIEVFKSAERFQANQDIKQYVSVVVLDEVGLAEDSPSLPLKALHPLLEDGTEGSGKDHQQQTVEREKRVAFIGISNWALDPAKMNRGVMVTRGAPGLEELQLSARGICSTEDRDPVREQLQRHFEPLSRAYLTICKKQERQFFGLRDYYSLIKMLYWMCKNSRDNDLSGRQLEHAIKRNFGGLESHDLNPLEEFQKRLGTMEASEDLPEELHSIMNPDCSRLGLIKTSLNTKDTTWHGENRYLLFLTENYAALDILKHYLNDGVERAEDEDLTTQPYILFGSSFPKDKEYTQVCRNINQIKICMETGRTVILLNLENLYESLYDVLNQYYMYFGGVRYVDLGLQTHRVKCRVHDHFKLILIAEKDTVYNKFPTPLINRLEKHFVLTSSVLEDWQCEVLREFKNWIQLFSCSSDSRGNQFREGHAFIGYQKDTPAAVIFQAHNQLKKLVERPGEQESVHLQRAGVFSNDISKVIKGSQEWSQVVLRLSQFLLLQTAADDALIRLKKSRLPPEDVEDLLSLYYKHQHHRSIREFLEHECREDQDVFMQVTTHSPLMTEQELMTVAQSLSMGFAHFDLHEFDSELDFSNKIGPKFLREESGDQPFLVVVQCDSGHLNHDLIACARYRVCDEAIKANTKNKIRERNDITHILFVIRLPQQEIKSQFVGFQGDPWISVHIDDLRPTSEATVIPEQALTAKISELFIGEFDEPEDSLQPHQDVPSEEEVIDELEESHEEREMSLSAEFDERKTYSYREEEMSEDSSSSSDKDEPYPRHFHSIEESGSMEAENDQPLFAVRHEQVLKDSASLPDGLGSSQEASRMEVQDIEEMATEQLYSSGEPAYSDVLLPIVEDMQTEEATHTSGEDLKLQLPILASPIPLATSIIPQLFPEEGASPTLPADVERGEGGAGEEDIMESTSHTELPAERVRESKSFHAQHRRLHGCIQAAVSMLKDSEGNRSMLRIQKLMTLIPKTSPDRMVEPSFYALLVKFIHQALKEREEIRKDERDWVVTEALSGRKLQSGGTFRNVLARRIDEVITPYFAELIAHIDQNCNLDLLDVKEQTTPTSLFWLEMFNVTGGRVDFSSLAKGKTDIKAHFRCQLPFSWFVREEVEAQRANAGGSQAFQHSLNDVLTGLCQTEVGEVLRGVSEEHVDEFYKQYLHDFVRYMHQSGNKGDLGGMEYKLIMGSLDAMARNPDLCSVDGHESLPRKIVVLHLLYSQCSTEVLQFGQLVQHRPGILHSLLKGNSSVGTDWDFTLHLSAVQRVLESDQEDDPTSQTLFGLNPPLHKDKQAEMTQNILRWVNHVRLSQNVIDTILRSSVKNEAAVKARLTWQRVRALQIFAEKVYLPNCTVNGMQFIIGRLEMTLKRHSCDFLRKETVDAVKRLLNNMFNKVKVDSVTKRKIKRDCNQFFIEVVSSLCFGGREAPEPDLVKTLLDTVLHDMGTSRLSPYKEPDTTPTIRSFLLQLLLEKEQNQVEECLSDYFDKSLRAIGGEPDQGLCLLCIQCFEDALRKRISVDHKSHEAAEILEESYLALQDHARASEHQVSLQYLQSVARVRFGLSVAAEQLRNGRSDDRLLRIVRDLCVDPRVNVIDPTGQVDTTGPVLYLVKLLIRQFGYPCLKVVCEDHPWVVPEELGRGEEEQKAIDPFVLYDTKYKDLRSAVNTVVFAKKIDELVACTQADFEPSLLAFAFYQKISLSRASREPSKQVPDEALHSLNTLVQESTQLSPDMMHVLRLLLGNQQGGPLAQLSVSPNQPPLCRTLGGIVIHTVSVILSKSSVELLLPLLNMLTNPTALKAAYLPTMAEDILQEVRKAGGQFYECPNGHPYFIGDCGRPVEEKVCRECHATIGGRNYQLNTTNRTARVNDTTKTGYDLGPPDHRPLNPERERDLSASAVCVVRALMHSAFIWASCNNQDDLVEIAQVTKGQVSPGNLAEFFWLHLERDMECVGRSTGRGVDECAMIVHLVLQRVLTTTPPPSPIAANVKHLQSKDARRQWEKLFSTTYIDPVLAHLDTAITKALDTVANDDQQEHDKLFYLAYEKVKVDESKLQAHLWTFRQQINLEHLHRDVQAKSTKKIPVLDAFLKAEPSLRATQYLPDIVKLQRFLFDMYDKRLDKGKAETLTIREFLKEVKERFNENTKNKCQERIESLKQAWALVGHKLKNHNRLPVEEKFLPPAITFKTHLIYLIPTTMKEGRCTTALVDYLVITHNDFIEHCRTVISKGAVSATAVWREHKVPITHLHRCHMLEYEQQLQSIILSHCHYSLTMGKGQEIKYDHPALEKHILDRFIYGKPVILVDIPNVAYRKDIYTVESFLEIRRKVKPQVALDQRVQQDIVTELKTPENLRASLDVVDIALGLLSSGGGNPKLMLKQFIDSRRMSRKSFSAKAKEHCTLAHIISLWETLSVELARLLWDNEQEPFEAVPNGYLRELTDDQKSELDKCLRTFDLGLLLGVLFEFIEVHVKQIIDMNQADYELVDAVDDYWGMTEQTQPPLDPDNFRRDFPSSITVDQAVATWKHVAHYQARRH